MANGMFDSGREGFLDGTIDYDTDTIEALLVRGYTANLSTHTVETSVTGAGGTIVARVTLASKTKTAGVADAADSQFAAVATGAACQHIILLANKGSAGTNRLILSIDTATGLPVTPNGGNIDVAWDNGANKIFKL